MDLTQAKQLFPSPHLPYLEQSVFPGLDQAVANMALHLFSSDTIAKYMEKLKEVKLQDEHEKRKLDKKRERELLGDENYESESGSGEEGQEEEIREISDDSINEDGILNKDDTKGSIPKGLPIISDVDELNNADDPKQGRKKNKKKKDEIEEVVGSRFNSRSSV